MSDRDTAIQQVFDKLNDFKVRYGLLRNRERLHSEPDIDLLCSRDDRELLDHCLKEGGFLRFSIPRTGRDRFYIKYIQDESGFLLIHVTYEIRFGCYKLLRCPMEKGLLERMSLSDGIQCIAPDDELRLLVLHCLLDKGSFEKYRERILQIARAIPAGVLKIPGRSAIAFSDINEDSFSSWMERRGSVIFRMAVRTHPGIWLGNLWRLFLVGVGKVLGCKPWHKGRVIAFIGMDGSGKSTLIDWLKERFTWPLEARTLYMGDNQYLLPPAKWIHSAKDKRAKKTWLLSALFLVLGHLDKLLRAAGAAWFRLRGGVVLCDRWFHDLLVNPDNERQPLRKKIKQIFFALSPKADRVILLDVSPQAARDRKPESSIKKLEAVSALYHGLRQSADPRIIVIENSAETMETCRKACLKQVWDSMIRG